jgi:hypothetical protein
MKRILLQKSLLVFISMVFICVPVFSSAQLDPATSEKIQENTTQTGVEAGLIANRDAAAKEDIKTKAIQIVQYILALLGTILVIMILWAGAQILFSGGNAEKIKAGKKTIVNAIAGLAIILVAYSGTVFLTKRLNQVFSEPQIGTPCKSDTDCPKGTRCAAQLLSKSVCAPWGVNAFCNKCTSDSNCPSNQRCVEGSFIPGVVVGQKCCK